MRTKHLLPALAVSLAINYFTAPVAAPIIYDDAKLHVATILSNWSNNIIMATESGRKLNPNMPPPVNVATLAEVRSGHNIDNDAIAGLLRNE